MDWLGVCFELLELLSTRVWGLNDKESRLRSSSEGNKEETTPKSWSRFPSHIWTDEGRHNHNCMRKRRILEEIGGKRSSIGLVPNRGVQGGLASVVIVVLWGKFKEGSLEMSLIWKPTNLIDFTKSRVFLIELKKVLLWNTLGCGSLSQGGESNGVWQWCGSSGGQSFWWSVLALVGGDPFVGACQYQDEEPQE